MKPVIVIPSYKRPDSRIFEKLQDIKLDKYVFVRPEESKEYQHTKKYGFKVISLKNVQDIGETRQSIMKYLTHKDIGYAFMFDDDVSKVEELSLGDKGWNATRILEGSKTPPGFTNKTLSAWFKWALENDMSLSSPVPRFNRKDKGRDWINSRDCVACVLVKVEDVMEVGNYMSTNIVGAEDVYIQYRLMDAGYKTGIYGLCECDYPAVGAGKGGNNEVEDEDLIQRYSGYVQCFKDSVGMSSKVTTKVSKTGLPSIKFVWGEWIE